MAIYTAFVTRLAAYFAQASSSLSIALFFAKKKPHDITI